MTGRSCWRTMSGAPRALDAPRRTRQVRASTRTARAGDRARPPRASLAPSCRWRARSSPPPLGVRVAHASISSAMRATRSPAPASPSAARTSASAASIAARSRDPCTSSGSSASAIARGCIAF